MTRDGSVLVTGASGLLGRMIAATLIAHEDRELVLPVRRRHDADTIKAELLAELEVLGAPAERLEQAHIIELPPIPELDLLAPSFARYAITEVVHCAGSLSYDNEASLQEGNIDFTRGLIALAQSANLRRFTYLSTAFASGLTKDPVPEALHQGQRSDPAAYMRSKREAEWLVADSGLPYAIVRPAIVIGDSKTGRYAGKPYGLYQVWASAEKFASHRYMPVIHAIAPRIPLQVVHQDAFQAAFLSLFRSDEPGLIAHIAGDETSLPTVRDLWNLWLQDWLRPEEVYYYDSLESVPMESLDRDQRLFVRFASANIEISTHAWRFQTPILNELRANGLQFADATVESVRRCQSYFLERSPRIQRFFAQNPDKRAIKTKVFE